MGTQAAAGAVSAVGHVGGPRVRAHRARVGVSQGAAVGRSAGEGAVVLGGSRRVQPLHRVQVLLLGLLLLVMVMVVVVVHRVSKL